MVLKAKIENTLSCPECTEDFVSMEEVYKHSAILHYLSSFSDLYTTDYLLKDGACCICSENSENLRSFFCYVEHFGGHHKLIHQFMTMDVLAHYLKLAAPRHKLVLSESVSTANIEEENLSEMALEDNSVSKHVIKPEQIESKDFSYPVTGKAISNHDLSGLIGKFLPEISDMDVGLKIERVPEETPTPKQRNHFKQLSSTEPVPFTYPTILLSRCFEAEKTIEGAAKFKLQKKKRFLHQHHEQDLTDDLSSRKPKEITKTNTRISHRQKELVYNSFNKQKKMNKSKNYFMPTVYEKVYDEIDATISEANQYQNKKEACCNMPKIKTKGAALKPVSNRLKIQTKETKPKSKINEKQLVKPKMKAVSRKQNRSKAVKYKCPECSYSSDHVSSIYSHSAYKHYFQLLADLYERQFMMTTSKVCTQCPGRSLAQVPMYVLHIGGKHKMIHKFISREIVELYEKFPAKKSNLGYNQSKLHPSLKCLVCKSGPPKFFLNITAYKQHLVTHYKEFIIQEYKKNYPSLWTESACLFCVNIEGLPNKPFPNQNGLIWHLGSKHNLILDYATNDILQQLKNYNVTKC